MEILFFNVPSNFVWTDQLFDEVVDGARLVYGVDPEITVMPIDAPFSKIHVMFLDTSDSGLRPERRQMAAEVAKFLQKYGIDEGADFYFPGENKNDIFLMGEFY